MAFHTYVAFVLGTSQRGSKTTETTCKTTEYGFRSIQNGERNLDPTDDLASYRVARFDRYATHSRSSGYQSER